MHAPKNDWDGAIQTLKQLAERHQATLIAIGNGTASRETDQLAKELIKRYPQLKLTSIMVSEAGASVYSASELASEELPELDVSLRGAVSIARRLQDPLARIGQDRPEIDRRRPIPAPHHAAQIQRNLPANGAYISLYWYGSPASRSRLRAARCITAVDGKPTPDLDSFLAAVHGKPNRASVRLKTLDLDDKVELITLRLDLDYFPTYELRLVDGAWVRTEL